VAAGCRDHLVQPQSAASLCAVLTRVRIAGEVMSFCHTGRETQALPWGQDGQVVLAETILPG